MDIGLEVSKQTSSTLLRYTTLGCSQMDTEPALG